MPALALDIPTAPVFEPLLGRSRYKAAHGGRGSGKSHFMAELLVERCMMEKTEWVCIREVQKTLKDSAKKLIEGKIQALGVGKYFDVQNALIKTPYGGQIIFQGMQDHTAESIKSLEGFDGAWVEEAQSLSETSMQLLRPTIRKDGSEIWFSWNPTRKSDAVEKLFRSGSLPSDSVVVEANWKDNPWFNKVLEAERLDCLKSDPDQYDHIWNGGYKLVYKGAYYADSLKLARTQGRIRPMALDPILPIYAAWDLGYSDATAIWVFQVIDGLMHFYDYIEAQQQPLSYYVNMLRSRGYSSAVCVLPHDSAQHDKATAVTYEDHLRSAGFETQVIANQGKGAAMQRIEAVRRAFPAMVFNSESDGVKSGLEAIGAYHERWDDDRDIGLGPEHDWSSHGADAFGLAAVAKTQGLGRSMPIVDVSSFIRRY